jgi:apolipoprotein N-acyltransferase
MHNYGGLPLWLCYIILVVFSATLGVFTGLFAAVLGLAIKRFGGWSILAAPAVWAASEWLRLQATGMGWNPLGYSQAFQPAVIQVSRFGGVYLVSAIMVAASTALVFALVYLERRRGIVVLTMAGLIAISAVLYGESLRPSTDETGSLSVAVVQPNIPVDGNGTIRTSRIKCSSATSLFLSRRFSRIEVGKAKTRGYFAKNQHRSGDLA